MNLELIFMLYIVVGIHSSEHVEVIEFGFKTSTHDVSYTSATVNVNAWFNQKVYQCIIRPTLTNTMYSCDNTSFVGSDLSSEINETKMLIENLHGDAVILQESFITTTSATYKTTGFCISDTDVASVSNHYIENYGSSGSELCDNNSTHIKYLCVDNEKFECAPSRQMFYVDTNQPDINNEKAVWVDATNIIVHITTRNESDQTYLYILVTEPKIWNEAEKYCQTIYNSHLATITDDMSAQALLELCPSCWRVWMGLSDQAVEGVWQYTDGTECPASGCGSTYKYWLSGEPNSEGEEDCVHVVGFATSINDMLNDVSCSKSYPFACNKPALNPATNPTKQPTFGPTSNPTKNPTKQPMFGSTSNPTKRPTFGPTLKNEADVSDVTATTEMKYQHDDQPHASPCDLSNSVLNLIKSNIGIVVGCIAGLCCICTFWMGCVFWCCLRWSRQDTEKPMEEKSVAVEGLIESQKNHSSISHVSRNESEIELLAMS